MDSSDAGVGGSHKVSEERMVGPEVQPRRLEVILNATRERRIAACNER